jgi:ribosomal protein L14
MTFYFFGRERKPMKRANGYLVRVKWNCCVVVLLVKDTVG